MRSLNAVCGAADLIDYFVSLTAQFRNERLSMESEKFNKLRAFRTAMLENEASRDETTPGVNSTH